MSTPRLTKLQKQPNSTWAQLQKCLITFPDPFEMLFPAEVWSFILNKSHSISTNPGYVSSTLITTTALMAGSTTGLKTATQEMPLNIYAIFVGPPTTEKSQAIKECAISLMASVTAEADSAGPVIQKCTLSCLIKRVADSSRGFLLSAEIYDVLFKLLKSDEENATGDVQVLKSTVLWRVGLLPVRHRKNAGNSSKHAFLHLRNNTDSLCLLSSRPLRSRTRSFRPIFNYLLKVLATDANPNNPGNQSLKGERPFQHWRRIRRDCSPASLLFHLHSKPRAKV